MAGYEYSVIYNVVTTTMNSCFSFLTFAFSLLTLHHLPPTTSLVLFEHIGEHFDSSGYRGRGEGERGESSYSLYTSMLAIKTRQPSTVLQTVHVPMELLVFVELLLS